MLTAELDTLQDAIDALAVTDPAALHDHELHSTIVSIQRERARLGAVAAQLLSRWDALRVWADDGSRSAPARLSRDVRCSLTSAAAEIRRARQLRALPTTSRAIDDGVLSLDHIDLLGRANQPHRSARFAEDEALLVEQCAQLRFQQANRVVQYWCARADAEAESARTAPTGSDAGPEGEEGHLHASTTLGGAVAVDGVLDPIGGAAFLAELRRLERELFLADGRDGILRTTATRRASALALMAQRSATAPVGGRAPKPLFTVLVGDDAFTELCELANGTVVHPRQLGSWLDTAVLETVLFDGPSTVVSVSHRRSFTGAVRRAIEVRDRHCQHPSGCDVPADQCDVDHIVPHLDGGETSQFNGRLECIPHNRYDDLHDHGATPLPSRPITRLAEIRARRRWRYLHEDDRGCGPPALEQFARSLQSLMTEAEPPDDVRSSPA